MAFATHQFKMDPAARRFVLWMAVGTAFMLALVAVDYFGFTPIP
jgi:hypothetical protein